MFKSLFGLLLCGLMGIGALSAEKASTNQVATVAKDLFQEGLVPRLRIEIPPDSMKVLRAYRQNHEWPRPVREDVLVTIREGKLVYTNVAVHLKGSYSFRPINDKPGLTLHFDKYAEGQRFHGLTKINLNNSVQDSSYLCEAIGRELFNAAGVPAPRGGHAMVEINGRDVGLYVILEGWNKDFLKRHFGSAKGNLYDGGSGGDITSEKLEVDCGANPEDRSDLAKLIEACRERDIPKRAARLEQLLDMDKFISFMALETLLIHWDGYSMGPNNFRLFHDVSRDKMVFMPGGMDQLFGANRNINLEITPHVKGLVARSVMATPDGRRRYRERLENIFTNQFTIRNLVGRVDEMCAQIRPALARDTQLQAEFDDATRSLKSHIQMRVMNVRQQLRAQQREQPVTFDKDQSFYPSGWEFKAGQQHPANGQKVTEGGHNLIRIASNDAGSVGAWRTQVWLDAGVYQFTGLGRTTGMKNPPTKDTGVILRISGERSTQGMSTAATWTPLSYEFTVSGLESVELICEYRGDQGYGSFDLGSLKLVRKSGVPTSGANLLKQVVPAK